MRMMIRKLSKHNPGVSTTLLYSEDIITEIFLWLPLKSLVRFKRLSKRWYFLICHKDSYFRRNYLSTLSSRRRNRIVSWSDDADDDFAAIMAGFFYQKPSYVVTTPYEGVRFLPSTSTQFKKYHFLPGNNQFEKYNNQQGGEAGAIEIINDINPFCSLDKSLDKFLLSCLHKDPAHQNIFIVASSNGFLLCTLEHQFPETYYLVNPVTMEWVALPKLLETSWCSHVGFVCKGDYPSLDLVEYTIVRLPWIKHGAEVVFQIFSSTGDNQWIEYCCSCESLPVRFSLSAGRQNTVMVSTSNSDDQSDDGIVVYVLVTVWRTLDTAIVVFDVNKDDPLQIIETPGPNRGKSGLGCYDYMREFHAGVIHYIRFVSPTNFEFWVLNTETREWCLKHRASLETMTKGYPLTDFGLQNQMPGCCYQIHAFHPMNPNLAFLTLNSRMVCYNIETGTLEMVYDFFAQNMLDDYCHYVYQWPCWPPLL